MHICKTNCILSFLRWGTIYLCIPILELDLSWHHSNISLCVVAKDQILFINLFMTALPFYSVSDLKVDVMVSWAVTSHHESNE
jgi:hypothetical protein